MIDIRIGNDNNHTSLHWYINKLCQEQVKQISETVCYDYDINY